MIKKCTTSAAAALLACLSMSGQTVFEERFPSEEAFSNWIVVDVNEDEKTWSYDATNGDKPVYYSYHSTNPADDWVISPMISIPESGSYLLTFLTKGSSYSEGLEIYVGSDREVSSMTNKIYEDRDLKLVDYSKSVLLDLEAGQISLGFHAVSHADAFRLYLGNITLAKIENPCDLGIASLLSPMSGEGLGEEEVSVKLVNNYTTPISSFVISYEMSVAGETVSYSEEVNLDTPLAAGAEMTYTFSQKADLSTPRTAYNITVRVSALGDVNPDNDTLTAEVRHVAAATVPYSMGFENDEDTSNLSYLNLNNDDGYWHRELDGWFTKFARTGYYSLCYNYNAANDADDWAFLDPLQLQAGYYCLKFWYSATENHTEKLKVCWGSSANPAEMTNVIIDLPAINNVKYQESVSIFQIPADGKYFVGFYAYSDKDENWLCIDDVTIESVDPDSSEIEVMALAKPFDYWRQPNSTEVTAKVRNIGVQDVTADAVLYVDGTEMARQNTSIAAMNEVEVTFEGVMGVLTAGAHDLKVEVEYAANTKPELGALEKEVVVLQEAVAGWDFENVENIGDETLPFYALPEDLTYRVEDSNTVNPDAGYEFNEDGFGIFTLGEHPVLGRHALAVSTWFTYTGSADRWVVLPRMHVNAENAWFAWDAMSYNPGYPERYRVKVSDNDDYWSHYNTEAEIDEETPQHKTRGISLSEYAGKDIYIAVHITTYDGEALVLDNLGVYGAIAKSGEVGVDGLAADDEAPVSYYTLQGIEVKGSQLTPGLYIRKQGDKTAKIVVK